MKATIAKRIRLTENVLSMPISDSKRNRFEQKLSFLKGIRKNELSTGERYFFERMRGYSVFDRGILVS